MCLSAGLTGQDDVLIISRINYVKRGLLWTEYNACLVLLVTSRLSVLWELLLYRQLVQTHSRTFCEVHHPCTLRRKLWNFLSELQCVGSLVCVCFKVCISFKTLVCVGSSLCQFQDISLCLCGFMVKSKKLLLSVLIIEALLILEKCVHKIL